MVRTDGRNARPLQIAALVALVGLAGCATRPVNPPLTHADHTQGYRFESRQQHLRDRDNLLILAFSGGGTRAAAFSYGVLEALRDVEVVGNDGKRFRVLDDVSVIAGVSGGSFTALAYGLYGDKMFAQYEQQFLKRNVEGELAKRFFSPMYWGKLSSTGWGRSEMAADYYDEILFNGATFADLQGGRGPMIVAAGTDITSGARFYFTQAMFDIICSDLSKVRLSRAAATSSAVPVVFSPVSYNNYGGTCGYQEPPWLKVIANPAHPIRPAARSIRYFTDLRAYENATEKPYVHVVDGGVGDNLGMRGILDILDQVEALRLVGMSTPLDHIKRIAFVVVNSLSSPKTDLDKKEEGPGAFYQFMQSTAVPIDHYSFEAVEMLRDVAARWKSLRDIRDSGALADKSNPALYEVMRVPNTEIYVIDVSFAMLDDATLRDQLNELPTSFVLPSESVDKLRTAARRIMHASPDFRRFLKDTGAQIQTPSDSPAHAH